MRLLVGIPTRGNPHIEAHYSIVRALEVAKVPADLTFQTCWHVVHGRNRIVRDFLKSDATHLVMIDDDVIVPECTIRKLVERASQGYDAVVGVVPSYGPDALFSNVRPAGSGGFAPLWPHGFIRAHEAGLAVCILSRRVLEVVEFPWFNWRESLSGSELGEDQDFCAKLRDVGIQLWADCSIRCGHLKTVDLKRFVGSVSSRISVHVLLTGCPRSGTRWAAEVLTRAGIDCGHERAGVDACACWFYACTRADDAPEFSAAHPAMLYDFGSIIHLVREPLACIASIASIDQSWMKWAEKYVGTFVTGDALIDAAAFWLRWQRMVLAQNPKARVRVEDGAGPLLDAVVDAGFECGDVSDPGPLNRGDPLDRREVLESLAARRPAMLSEIAELARSWGYEVGEIVDAVAKAG